MTKQFSKWVSKQKLSIVELSNALDEVKKGNVDAYLGGNLYKKRIRFEGQGKSGSGRTIICYKKGNIAIYIHGFAKNEKDNLSAKELRTLKAFAKILTELTESQIKSALANGDFKEIIS